LDLSLAGKAPEVSNYNLGVGYSLPKVYLALRAGNKLSEYSALATYDHAKTITLVSSLKYSTKKSAADVTVGGIYCCHPTVALKLKATTEGLVAFSAKKSVGKTFALTGAAEFNIKEIKDAKFGVTASLG
jgi:hypothetical protein